MLRFCVTYTLTQRHPRESGDPDLFPVKAWNQIQKEVGSSGQARRLGLDPRFREDDEGSLTAFRTAVLQSRG